MVAVAIVGAAAIGGVASMSAAGSASKNAKETRKENNALQADIYGQNKAALDPFRTTGGRATTAIESLLGLSGDPTAQNAAFENWQNSTGFQNQLKEGERGLGSAFGAHGLLDSGAAKKGLADYRMGKARESFGSYYSMLAGQQGVGLTAASAQAGVGQNYANAVSNNNNIASETASNAALAKAGQLNNFLGQGLSAYGAYSGMGSSYGAAGR